MKKPFSMKQKRLNKNSDENVCQYKFIGTGRLILDTIHGQIIIDVRCKDVNSFVIFEGYRRVDKLLIKIKEAP